MKINSIRTYEYYNVYSPCDCGDYRYFINHIENEQPKLCEYLKSLSINPLKPYKLVSLYFEKDKRIEYFDCAYVVFGIINENFEIEISGIKGSACSKEKYPLLDTQEDYFLISFGPIYMNCAYVYNRYFTFNDKVQIIKQAIDKVDPMGLLAMQCPKDEYMREALIIAEDTKFQKTNFIDGKYIQKVFKKQFDETITMKKCNDIARIINIYLDRKDYFKDIEEIQTLKGLVTSTNSEITLKIHDDFILKIFKNRVYNAYLNDKFYYDIEEQDLLDSLCAFVEDDDTIYVQYKHYHFGFNFGHYRYFQKIKRSKYSYRKLKHKKDIELIFDNKGVIFSRKMCKLSKQEIIDLQFNEQIKEEYDKVFYSPDKLKRLIVSKNSLGSYSYHIEQLVILEGEEIYYSNKPFFWEPIFNGVGVSYYENINDLLKDIDVEIRGWIEK